MYLAEIGAMLLTVVVDERYLVVTHEPAFHQLPALRFAIGVPGA
jgi:hypothetical protein